VRRNHLWRAQQKMSWEKKYPRVDAQTERPRWSRRVQLDTRSSLCSLASRGVPHRFYALGLLSIKGSWLAADEDAQRRGKRKKRKQFDTTRWRMRLSISLVKLDLLARGRQLGEQQRTDSFSPPIMFVDGNTEFTL
jgi:hypothetical protein